MDPSLLHWQADALPLSHLGSHAMKNIYLQIKNAEEKRVERKAPKCTGKWWQWLGGPNSAWFPFDQCLLSGKGGNMSCSVRQSLAGHHAVMSNGDHQGVTRQEEAALRPEDKVTCLSFVCFPGWSRKYKPWKVKSPKYLPKSKSS